MKRLILRCIAIRKREMEGRVENGSSCFIVYTKEHQQFHPLLPVDRPQEGRWRAGRGRAG